MSEKLVPPIHGPDHAPGGPDPIPGGNGIYAIEVFEVDIPVTVGDNAFNWEIPEDLDEAALLKVEAYVNDPSSSVTVELQIAKEPEGGGSVDLLTTKISIEAGDLNSKDAASQPVVTSSGAEEVAWGDHLRIDVDAAGDAVGLGVILYFFPAYLRNLSFEGSKGDPGGVDAWTGQWTTSTSYTAGESVSNNGSSYVAIDGHTSGATTEPGVGVDWEDHWQLLVEAKSTSAIEVVINGNGHVIDVGPKAYIEVPFDCTIDEVIMLGDFTGSAVVDIWKDTFANYPPTNADSITASTPPTISASNKSVDSTLSGWTTGLSAGDILGFNVDSCSTITILAISLKVLR